MGIIENSHRADDEYFLMIQGETLILLSFSTRHKDGRIHGISTDPVMVLL